MYFESGRDNKKYFARKDNACAPHFHRSVEILYVLSGEKTVEVGGETLLLSPRDMLVCAPYLTHAYAPNQNGEQFVLTVPTQYCEAFEKACERALPATAVYHDTDGELLPVFERLHDCGNDILFTGFINLLLGVFLQHVPLVKTQKNKERTLVERIVEYIDAQYAEDITLHTLARRFGYSPNYFSSLFKRHFRIGLPAYLNGVRVRKSVKLLPTHHISSIYALCGFHNSQQYFLHFKKTYGCTPKQYLKILQ